MAGSELWLSPRRKRWANWRKRDARAVSIFVACLLAGCAPFKPVPLDQTDLMERVESATDEDVTVRIAVPTVDESRALFSSKLHKKKR